MSCLKLLCWCCCCQGCCKKEDAKEPLLDKRVEPQKATEVQEMEYKYMVQSEGSSEAGTDWESDVPSGASSPTHPEEVDRRESGIVPANASPRGLLPDHQSSSSGEAMVRSTSGRASWKLVPSPTPSPNGKSQENQHS